MKEKEFKSAFFDLVYDVLREGVSDKDFQFIMEIVNRIICDKKEKELLKILKFQFPEYYNLIKSIR